MIRSAKVLAVPLENTEVQMQQRICRRPCEVGHQERGSLSFLDLNWTQLAVEPRTSIEFPAILDNILDRQNNSSLASEVKYCGLIAFANVTNSNPLCINHL